MTFKSAALLSQVLRYQVAPDGSRNQRAIAVDFGRGNISAQSKSVDIKFVHALSFFIAAPFFEGGSLFRSYSSLCILALRLELRALPSNSRKLFAKSLTKSSPLWHSYPTSWLLCQQL